MTETETIKAALARFAFAADAYEQAKSELARLLAPSTGGGAPVADHKTPKVDPHLEAVKQRMGRPRKRDGDTIRNRILSAVGDYKDWPVKKLAAKVQIEADTISGTLNRMVADGEVRRVSRGVYACALAKHRVEPKADDGGLTPHERAIVIKGQTRAHCDDRPERDPPTAEERILAALGGGAKKWSELLELCSLTAQGASEAMADLTKAGKITSRNGTWKLKGAA